jgi:hypothetical protein
VSEKRTREKLAMKTATSKNGRPRLELSPAHLADLHASGLSDATIRAAGLYTEADPSKVAQLLHWQGRAGVLGECLVFPFKFTATGGVSSGFARLKPSSPRQDADGKVVKYESPRGLSNRTYFPPSFKKLLAAGAPLIVTEGEKKSLKAAQEGFAAIGLTGVWGWQQKRPRDENGRPHGPRQLIDDLAAIDWRGRRVLVVFDSDRDSKLDVRKAESELAAALAPKGAEVRVAALPHGPRGAKVGLDDYLCAHSADDLRTLLAAATPAGAAASPVSLDTRCLDGVKPEPVSFLVEKYIPVGKVTLFGGRGGLGKSAVTLDLAAAVTTGRPAFGLRYTPPPPADVLLCFAEDDAADTVVPRLQAAGADLKRVLELQGVRGPDGRPRPFSLADCDALTAELKCRPEVRLVVIDPAGVFAGRTGIDTHREAPVQALLAGLRDLAISARVAVVLVAHVNKSSDAKARDRVSGSAAFVNSARAVYLFTDDESADSGRRLILPIKNNYTADPAGLVYAMRPLNSDEAAAVAPALDHLDTAQQQALLNQLFRVKWEGTTTESADEVLQRKRGQVKDVDRAADWLKNFLAARPMPSDTCAAEGNKALGLSRDGKWWRDAVLKAMLGGKAQRAGFGRAGTWYYTLSHHPWPFPGLVDGTDEEEAPAILRGPFRSGAGEGGSPIESAEEPSTTPPDSLPSLDSMDSMATAPQQGEPAPIESIEGIESKESGPVQEGNFGILCPDDDAEVF